jgi:hypothetical protein
MIIRPVAPHGALLLLNHFLLPLGDLIGGAQQQQQQLANTSARLPPKAKGRNYQSTNRDLSPPSFSTPQQADHGIMPTDFLAWTTMDETAVKPSAVIGREFNNLSTTLGSSWRQSTPGRHFSSVIHFYPRQCGPIGCHNVSTVGRIAPLMKAPSNATTTRNFQAQRSYSFALHGRTSQSLEMVGKLAFQQLVFTGLPRPVRITRDGGLGLGGTSSLSLPSRDGWLMSAIVQFDDNGTNHRTSSSSGEGSNLTRGCVETRWCPASSCCPSWCRIGPGNQTSVVLFKSVDGERWHFLSTVADAIEYPQSHEGISENDMTFLADGKTIFAVLRLDGGDGCKGHESSPYDQHYLNYHKSLSTDFGRTWSRLSPLPAGCARPRVLLIGSALVMTGGRHRNANTSDVSLWLSADGRGESWEEYSLSYRHNLGAANGSLPLFDARVNQSTGPWTAPRQTNAYTSVTQVDTDTLMVFYDQHIPCIDRSGNTMQPETTRQALHYCAASFSMVVRLNNSCPYGSCLRKGTGQSSPPHPPPTLLGFALPPALPNSIIMLSGAYLGGRQGLSLRWCRRPLGKTARPGCASLVPVFSDNASVTIRVPADDAPSVVDAAACYPQTGCGARAITIGSF